MILAVSSEGSQLRATICMRGTETTWIGSMSVFPNPGLPRRTVLHVLGVSLLRPQLISIDGI